VRITATVKVRVRPEHAWFLLIAEYCLQTFCVQTHSNSARGEFFEAFAVSR
jgi:hypothetical protein